MKVRCIDNARDTLLKFGEIYEVKRAAGEYYLIEYKPRLQCWYNKKRFEEVKEMEKTFREVIADIKPGEVWECTRENARVKTIRMSEFSNASIIAFDYGCKISETRSAIQETDIFKLKRKEYTFEEAFKAYEEGKEIENIVTKYKFKKSNDGMITITQRAGNITSTNESSVFVTIDEIRGKWYIND